MNALSPPPRRRLSLDRNIERLREQLAQLRSYFVRSAATRSLAEFDLETERLISDILGESSDLLGAYEYAQVGEAAGLVNMTDEAPESVGLDGERQTLLQRSRVLESCIAELEARLEDRNDELRELTEATLGLLRQKLNEEKLKEARSNRLN